MLGKAKREEIVRSIVENKKLIVKHGFDAIDISEGIDWHYEHSHNTKTYSVYLHAIEYVGYLVLAGKEHNNDNFYEIAKNIILSWEKQDSEESAEYSWNEHAVSYRLNNLMLFQDSVPEEYKLDKKLFSEILIKHCAFLADDNNYRPNNHGILMDESLFKASFYMTNKIYQELYKSIALNRVKLALYRDFSRKGLHSENSPEYHRMMMIVLNRFNSLIQEKGLTLTNDLNHKLKKAKRIQRILLKPDMTYPLIGDTSLKVEDKVTKLYEDYYDYEAGIAIFQKENKKSRRNSDFLYFKCGYLSKTHKHFDDLSLSLVLDGNDVLIDSGKYNYVKSDKVRQFMISPKAHSVPLILNKSYFPSSPIVDQYNLGIDFVEIDENYKKVRGFNNLYEGINLLRTIIYTKYGHVFIYDEVISETDEILVQNFNLHYKAIIDETSNSKVKLDIGNQSYIIKTFNNDAKISETDGYFSEKFSVYEKNTHIEIENAQGQNESLILICNENIIPQEVTLLNKKIVFKFEDENLEIDL